jgi:hypothetical protein
MVEDVAIVWGSGITPHRPVKMTFVPRINSVRVEKMDLPPKLGTARVFGPMERSPRWNSALELSRKALEASNRMSQENTRELINLAWTKFSWLASIDIVTATGGDWQKIGKRGKKIKVAWRSPLNKPELSKNASLESHEVDNNNDVEEASQEGFVPSLCYEGIKEGMVFKTGPNGTGYYNDIKARVYKGHGE